jgi:hypothetical protein
MTAIDIIAIGGAVWAGTNAIFSAIKMANERRDSVILGYLDKQPLSREHKSIIIYSDWMMMMLWLAILSLGGPLVLVTMPWWGKEFQISQTFAEGAAFVGVVLFIGMFISVVIGGNIEFYLMKKSLEKPSNGDKGVEARQIERTHALL